ncbi:hypothetical protein GOP47_0011002 [Adiantum capillus-veneris]|uniref:Pentatricopeptide repeat-containing protein n=1 Tax=Adiantum capillus-veneris TaxID=13818 RepID=A0A9D4ZJ89_ADICA|nr:hypothetical protein GOP47_0011002 [Adiantum capillus-veneris]
MRQCERCVRSHVSMHAACLMRNSKGPMGAAYGGRRNIKISSKSSNRTLVSARQAKRDSRVISLSFVNSLKACAKRQDLYQGSRIHADIRDSGLLEKNIYLGNSLVSMYAKCGALVRAQQVVDELRVRDVVSWTALITGYVQHGQGKEALCCFCRMRSEGLSPNAITYACILKACGITQEVDMGEQMHGEIVNKGLLENNVVLGSALVDMYAKCGVFSKARKVLDELPVRNVVSWSALIAGYVRQGQGEEALGCFQKMKSEGLSPDAITYACILKACGITQDANMGKQIHDEIASQGLLEKEIMVGSALVDMYAKCGAFTKAHKMLDELPVHDVVSWSALIARYAQEGKGQEALSCFQKMRSKGFSPNAITYACILKACGITQDIDMGKQIHDEIVSQGLLGKDVVLGSALVDMYAKCGVLAKAQNVLDKLPVRDAVTWSALIAGYAQQGHGHEALGCFKRMRSEGFSPDAVTYACVLKACGITQDVGMGEKIHEKIASQGLLKDYVKLGNALVDMYVKCGLLAKAQNIFDELPVRNVVSWSALIAGYAQKGQAQEALGCFQRMRSEGISPNLSSWNALIGGYAQQGLAKETLGCFQWMQHEGVSPDAITFVNVLNACSHSGLLDEGHMYFDNMRETYGILPDKEHYTCMVDLFGRARLFDKATRVIKMMPSSDYPPVWSALLGACQKWGNVKLGRFAFDCAVQLDGSNATAYVLMTNIYAASGMQEEADTIEHRRLKNAT